MFCPYCGGKILEEDKFCPNCGNLVSPETTSPTPPPIKIKNTKKIDFGDIITKIVIIIVVLGIIGGAIYYYGDYKSKRKVSSVSDVSRSIVNVICEDIDSGGSGVMFTSDGLVLTNNHVVSDSTGCLITLPNSITGIPEEIYVATPIIIPELSEQYDIAMLSIVDVYVDEDGTSYGTYPKTFQPFEENNVNCFSYQPKLGDDIKIYGYPITSGGYNLTITEGIISSFTEDGLMLTSAKIDSGNSGGLAISDNGCFVGIPSAIQMGDYQNLGLIIPADIILDFADQVESQSSYTSTSTPTPIPKDDSNSLFCNGQYWDPCQIGEKFHCPKTGDPFCCDGVICHDECWEPCPAGQEFVCPAVGDPSCCPSEFFCNNQCWDPCDYGYKFICPSVGDPHCE